VIKKLQKIVFLMILLCGSDIKAQVIINEYSASNLTQFVDNHSDYEDWIELYNTAPFPMPLGGFHLSDDSTNILKYTIPAAVVVPANGFVRFWCSGRDNYSTNNYHTNFRLTQTKNSKEQIVFSDPTGIVLDSLSLNKTQVGHSRGRTTDGAGTWSIFTNPSPNTSNNFSTPYSRYADKPDFSVGAGFYPPPIIVILTNTEPGSTMRYTTDGSLPTLTSPICSTGVLISTTSVLKAITWSPDPNVLPSFVEYQTYFMNVSHTLPIISIAASQLTTLANGSGSLEPKGTFEYFDTAGVRKANTYGEFNRHGQDSWVLSQRSLDFISRDEMGYNHSIEEKLFEYSPRENFQRIILRAAGDDNYPADHRQANLGSAHVRDAYIHMLAKKGGMNLDVRNAEKAIVYLNGAYWGVYDIRENPDEHDYTEYYYGQDKYNLQYIETWGNTWAEYGGPTALSDWAALYSYIMTNSMANAANYNYVNNLYDGTSLVDYVIANAMTVCSDWLNYNTGWWRGMDSTGTHRRWGYILWDNDATFGHYINYTGIPNTSAYADICDPEGLTTTNSDPEGHIQVLNRLRQNPDFNQFYISRIIDLWNTVFSCDNMIGQLDSIVAKLDPEMSAHANRWNGTYAEWLLNVDTLRTFILNRCNNLATGINSCYNLNGPYEITLTADPISAGGIKFNTLVHDSLPWKGNYFGGMLNILEALPDTPYQFINWSSGSQVFLPNDSAIISRVNFTSNDTVVAHFSFATPVFEVTGDVPLANVYPTMIDQFTTLDFSLPEALPVSIQLFNINGQLISTLADNSYMQTGFHSMRLSLNTGKLNEGVYILKFRAGNTQKSFKLVYTGR
jgi:hypothetical protein